MGTNYYLRGLKEELHIGNSSGGWCFSLRVHPKYDINSLDDWIIYFNIDGTEIRDEYNLPVDVNSMLSFITERGAKVHINGKPNIKIDSTRYSSWEDFLDKNYAIPGPKGLLRYRIPDGCLAHGDGTWDYLDFDFS